MAASSNSLLGHGRVADIGLSVLFAAAYPLLRKVLQRFVYQPLGIRLMFGNKKTDDKDGSGANMAKLAKWNESSWKATCFTLLSLTALVVSYSEAWFADSREFWRDCTALPCTYDIGWGVLLFYCMEAGFYMQSIPFLIFVETRRKDFLESMTHHIVTLILILYSYYLNLTRVGVMIMLLHDVCDVPLEIAKLFRYCGKQGAADGSFGIFFILWVVMRMVYFPLVIIRSTWYESIELAAIPHNIDAQPHHGLFNGMLLVLFVLHCYWSYLIFKVLYQALTADGVSDIREDDDD